MWQVEEALRTLAVADRRRASELARALLDRCDPDELADAPDFSSLVQQLAAFPTLDALLARLDEDGVTALARDAAPIATLEDALRARGRLLRFDCETGHVPASHPEVLYWLAELAGITDAHFEQDVEEDGDDLADGLCYALRAYFRGNILTGPAENCGDFYDVHASIGMVNALARQAGHPWRVAAIGAPDQVITVVAAPEPALHHWRATGLLAFEPDGNE
jgi:hypothetical protein